MLLYTLKIYYEGVLISLIAWPGRKQATVTKLRIYSMYSPRSSMCFLARCSNFCKSLKKKFGRLSIQPGLRSCNDHVGRKMATFQLYFQSREQVVGRRGQIWVIGWVIKTLEGQVGQFRINRPVLVETPVAHELRMLFLYNLIFLVFNAATKLGTQKATTRQAYRWVANGLFIGTIFFNYQSFKLKH